MREIGKESELRPGPDGIMAPGRGRGGSGKVVILRLQRVEAVMMMRHVQKARDVENKNHRNHSTAKGMSEMSSHKS